MDTGVGLGKALMLKKFFFKKLFEGNDKLRVIHKNKSVFARACTRV